MEYDSLDCIIFDIISMQLYATFAYSMQHLNENC